MKVTITVTREYAMDETRILARRDFQPPAADADNDERRRWLADSFWELCGFARDEDHVDGSYVQVMDEYSDTEFEWPDALTAAAGSAET